MDVKWIKIVTNIFDDEKILLIESMPEADSIIVIWFKLLCLAGKQNNSGVFVMGRIPYTEEMFSTIFRRPLNTVRLALRTFEQFGMIEVINNCVTIPNWDKHQSIEQIEARREYQRQYHVEYRKKQKLLAQGSDDGKDLRKCLRNDDVNPLDKIRGEETREDKKRKEKNNSVQSAAFETFWKSYPRKQAKVKAQSEFQKLNPDETMLSTILNAVEVQKHCAQWERDGGQYIPLASTWLHQRRWEDEVIAGGKKDVKTVRAAQYEQRQYTEEELASIADDPILKALEAKGA